MAGSAWLHWTSVGVFACLVWKKGDRLLTWGVIKPCFYAYLDADSCCVLSLRPILQEDDEDAGYFDEVMSDGEVKLGKGSLEALAADKAKRAKKSGKKKGRK